MSLWRAFFSFLSEWTYLQPSCPWEECQTTNKFNNFNCCFRYALGHRTVWKAVKSRGNFTSLLVKSCAQKSQRSWIRDHKNQTTACFRVGQKEEIWDWSVSQEINFNCHNHQSNTSSLATPPTWSMEVICPMCGLSCHTGSQGLFTSIQPWPASTALCLSSRSQKTCQTEHFSSSGMFHLPPSTGCCSGLMCDSSEVVF